MQSWTSYPKIYNLGHHAVQDVTKSLVYVEEKIDGSQISFGISEEGKLKARSRNQEIIIDAPEKMFAQAVETVKGLQPLLIPGWTYRGEYLSKPKHNTLEYSRVPEKNIILFDVNTGDQEYLKSLSKQHEASRLGLECVPLLYEDLVDMETLQRLLNTESVLGGPKIEGVVIKPQTYSLFGEDGKALMAKHVSEEFKESHQRAWKESNPSGKDKVAQIIEGLRTVPRWEKAVQRLRDSGELAGDPRDIGPLIKSIQADTREETEDEVKEVLFEHFWPQINRGIVGGFAQWYKEQLMKHQFEGE